MNVLAVHPSSKSASSESASSMPHGSMPHSSISLRSLTRPVLARPVPGPRAPAPVVSSPPSGERAGRAHAAVELYELAVEGLAAAAAAPRSDQRFEAANLAALRGAAAVVAVHAASRRTRPPSAVKVPSGRVVSVWKLLREQSPELREWADFFASGTARRAALHTGAATITTREADDLLRDAVAFIELVGSALGLEIERLSGLGECLAVIHAPQ